MVAPTKKIIFIVGEAFRLPLLCTIIVHFRAIRESPLQVTP